MRLPTRDQGQSISLKMTPMIDVVFLLLVFFVWTSSFDLPEFDLPSSMAQPPSGGIESESIKIEAEDYDELIVKVDEINGETVIRVNDQSVDGFEPLRGYLKSILELGIQPPVIIDPSDRVTMLIAVRLYDIARDAGADRVLFAVRPSE